MSPPRLLTRVLGFAFVGLWLVACSAAETADVSEASGGQTGSLIPRCLTTDTSPFVVTEGDTAFAQQINSGFSQAKLTDEAGNDVPLVETREGNTSVLHTENALLPGTYILTDQCADFGTRVTREIVVVEAMALPEQLGSVEAVPESDPPFCSQLTETRMLWTPATDFVPYVNLTQFTLFAGTQRRGVIAQKQPFELHDGTVEVNIPVCPATDTCMPGAGEYRVEARIIGVEGTWSSTPFELDPQCKPDPIEDSPGPCSVVHGRPRRVNTWAAALFPLVLWLARRRSTRTSARA